MFQTLSEVREPREIRGRLRHCIGLQTPRMPLPQGGKAGARSETRSQDIDLVVLVGIRQRLEHEAGGFTFSDKENDEAGGCGLFPHASKSMGAFTSLFPGIEGFFVFIPRTGPLQQTSSRPL